MVSAITSPTDCAVRAVIQYFWAKKIQPTAIHCELRCAYGKSIISYKAIKNGGNSFVKDAKTFMISAKWLAI